MSTKVKKSIHFYITFLGLFFFSWQSHYRNYLINMQYQTFSMYWKFSHFADFEQVIIKFSHFPDFEQVIIKISHQQNSLGRNRILGHFFLRPLPCVTGTPPELLRPVRVSTGSEFYPVTGFFEYLTIQFFNSSHVTYGTPCPARGHPH